MTSSEHFHEVTGLSPEYVAAIIARYGDVPELSDPEGWRDIQETPDEDLTDDEFYGRHGWSRNAPVCDDDECFMCGDDG